jgi:hypothetical protein
MDIISIDELEVHAHTASDIQKVSCFWREDNLDDADF